MSAIVRHNIKQYSREIVPFGRQLIDSVYKQTSLTKMDLVAHTWLNTRKRWGSTLVGGPGPLGSTPIFGIAWLYLHIPRKPSWFPWRGLYLSSNLVPQNLYHCGKLLLT